jgi:hypothetical protein
MGESTMALQNKIKFKNKDAMIKKIKFEILIYFNSLIVEH